MFSDDVLMIFCFLGYTKLVVIGGYKRTYLSRVEAYDMEDASKTCSKISDYPQAQYAIAVGVMQGYIKACGGTSSPSDVCYDYHPESNTWVNSLSMRKDRWYHRASII